MKVLCVNRGTAHYGEIKCRVLLADLNDYEFCVEY